METLNSILYEHIWSQWRIQDFPEVRAPTLRGRGATYDFAKIPQKLHEIERIWTLPGGVPRAPLDPPLVATSLSL